jgi:hypothetical protein
MKLNSLIGPSIRAASTAPVHPSGKLSRPGAREIKTLRQDLYRLALFIGCDGVPYELLTNDDDAIVELCRETRAGEVARILITTGRVSQQILASVPLSELADVICGTLTVSAGTQPLTFGRACELLESGPRIRVPRGKLPPEGIVGRCARLDGSLGGQPWTASMQLMSYLRQAITASNNRTTARLRR